MTWTMDTALAEFAALVEANEIMGLCRSGLCCEANYNDALTRVIIRKKYALVDVGASGRFMVELSTGDIYTIKAYGVVHRGHPCGNVSDLSGWREANESFALGRARPVRGGVPAFVPRFA